MIHKLHSTRRLGFACRLLLFTFISGIIFLCCVVLQAGSALHTLSNFFHQPLLIALNLFPIVAVFGFLTLLIGNLFWAGSMTALLFHLLSLVNLIKIECRNDPLVPPDFALLNEAVTATGSYHLELHVPILILIFLFSGLLFLAGFHWRGTIKRTSLRIAASAVLCALFLGSMSELYPSADLYRDMVASVPKLDSGNVPTVFDELGFVYCFLHNYHLYNAEMPAGYSEAEAAAWSKEAISFSNDSPSPCTPDIIMIQCEAFSDVFDAAVFDYPDGENPLELFHRVAASDQSVSGHIVVSNYGAGTANTEFDMMTGIGLRWLNENSTSAFRLVHRNLPSLARLYASEGYDTWFMHPGDRWFYNRESVYNYLGISDQTFLKDLDGSYPKKCGYFSDEGFGLVLKERYEAQKQHSDHPLFAFTVTIENHQSYYWQKYTQRPATVPLRKSVSEQAEETLSVYAEGIRDSSQLLYDLTAFLDQKLDPVLLVFWGDHLPALGKNFSVYQEIGLSVGNESNPESAIETYSTPFVIWANRSFCEQYDFASRVKQLDFVQGSRISDVYLSSMLYELSGLRGTEAYWDYLSLARRALPVICRGRYVLADGSVTTTLEPKLQAISDKLLKWAYYRFSAERVK